MGALMDLVKVLFEPTAVFERVREKPSFLMPFIGLSIVQMIVTALNLPFVKAMMQARMASAPAGAPDPSKFAVIGILTAPIGIALILVILGFVLWVLVSIMGGEAKFRTLMSVAAYSAVPSVVLLNLIGSLILRLKGVESVTSPMDMQPAVGLDLLMPGATGFLGAVLKGINPFSIWALVLTAIGVSTTHKLSKGTGYAVATISFLLGLMLGAAAASMFAGRAG
jgi:membrane protein, antimicrobial resistance system